MFFIAASEARIIRHRAHHLEGMTTELPAPLQIREIEASEFALVWPIFHAVVRAGDTYAYDPEMPFEEARDLWTRPPARCFVASRGAEMATTRVHDREPRSRRLPAPPPGADGRAGHAPVPLRET
jgi:hypothetical protein